VLVVLSGVALLGLYVYMNLTERQIVSGPPPGYEDRLKYDHEGMPGSTNPNQIPVDLWFGKHDGIYDTTHLRVYSDYLTLFPFYHGEGVHLRLVWPSMLSLQTYDRRQKQEGYPTDNKRKTFTIILTEASDANVGDQTGTDPILRCELIVRDEARGLKYCNENRFDNEPNRRLTHYWPLSENLRTPWYNNPPNAWCTVVERKEGDRFEACTIDFSYNADVNVTMLFVPEQLAIEIITDFTRLTDFLSTLEVKP
jgi:hypothetical protein